MINYFIDEIMSKFSYDIGIDLGTANTPIIVRNKGIRLREPSFIAFDKRKKKVIAVGHEAKLMQGKEPEYIDVIRPMRDGIINNFEAVQQMIHLYLEKLRLKGLFKPRAVIGIPTEATPVERKSVLEAARLAGCRSAYVVEQTVAAAIGAGLPIDKPYGSMILDIGGGTSEAAVISLGNIVTSKSIKVAGDKMDEAIIDYVKKKYNLLIGNRTAEEVKIFLGNAKPSKEEKFIKIRGCGLTAKLPESVKISNNEVAEALSGVVNALGNLVKSTLESVPPELTVDIIDSGIVLAGGGSQLAGLDEYLTEAAGVRCVTAPEPSYCVVYGLNKMFNNLRLLKLTGTYSKSQPTAPSKGGAPSWL